MALSKIILSKQPGETRRVSMDFSNKMTDTETIVTIDEIAQSLANGEATTDLVFSGQVINGQIAQFLVSGGTIPARSDIPECDYKVTVRITTDQAQILENDGILKVKED